MRQISLTFCFFLCFYLLELGASYLFYPRAMSALDAATAHHTIFTTEPRLVTYGLDRLASEKETIALIGASNVREGFRPSELAEYFSDIDIHNLAVGASDMRQLREVVKLILAAVPNERRVNLTIVLGIWYGSFVNEDRRWKGGPTDVAAEMLRYGLYRENGSNLPIARFNATQLPYLISAVRPFMLASRAYYFGNAKILLPMREYVVNLTTGTTLRDIDIDIDTHIVNKEEKDNAILFWEQYMGPLPEWNEKGFDVLYSIAKEVSFSGAKLILVDLPIPSWHSTQVAYDRIYQARLAPRLVEMSLLTGFSFGSMREGFNDSDYYDSVHPSPKVTRQWASRVAQIIEPVFKK
jgi:hypothetical protein